MEHIQCHLFTILHKYASLANVFRKKGRALSEYCRPDYSSSMHFLNLCLVISHFPSLYLIMTLIYLTLSSSLHSKAGYSLRPVDVCLLPHPDDQHYLLQLQLYKEKARYKQNSTTTTDSQTCSFVFFALLMIMIHDNE